MTEQNTAEKNVVGWYAVAQRYPTSERINRTWVEYLDFAPKESRRFWSCYGGEVFGGPFSVEKEAEKCVEDALLEEKAWRRRCGFRQ